MGRNRAESVSKRRCERGTMRRPPALCARMLHSSLRPIAAHRFSLSTSGYKVLGSQQNALGASGETLIPSWAHGFFCRCSFSTWSQVCIARIPSPTLILSAVSQSPADDHLTTPASESVRVMVIRVI